ncbi:MULTISPECIES: DUF4406 domain-containing protein [Pseudomonas]|uniref:DUF4406 domain-containing protein n=1 Tax=Pseudomonas TaxID=286 RepID=UPI000A581F81|nr:MULTISPECIES: DUF4406 domain-containing protein [Pseudomonas]
MTGLPGFNFTVFHAMTANLRSDHTVTNPAELNFNGGTWSDCLRRDLTALMDYGTVHPPQLGAFKRCPPGSADRRTSQHEG